MVPPVRRRTAEQMATEQRQISVADFFSKNRHLLGFDNPRRALLTAVKEAVDNALDACEEAGILPLITLQLENFDSNEEHFIMTVSDNGPGIVPKQIPNVFGRLLYGSKFHRRKQSRGQQGIGISAAGMYGLISTGRAMEIWSRTSPKSPCYYCKLKIDMSKNMGVILQENEIKDWTEFEHGTRVKIALEGKYIGGRQGIDEYLRQTAIANPHSEIHFHLPNKSEIVFPRAVENLPAEPKEIMPHPYGVELGILMKMLESTECSTLSEFLRTEFSNISSVTARQICEATGHVTVRSRPKTVSPKDAQALHKAIMETKISRPRLDCLVPIGSDAILAGMKKEVKAEFYNAVSRPPQVYRGNPFQVEVGIAYGWQGGNAVSLGAPVEEPPKRRRKSLLDDDDDKGQDEPIRLTRFANRVPLQYKQTDCALYKSVTRLNWRNYGLSQKRGQLPFGPMEIFIHMVSVWVPFTSESKEAIAEYDEIAKEIRLAVAECGRQLGVFLNRKKSALREAERRRVFELYIEEVANSCHEILPQVDLDKLRDQLIEIARTKTEVLLPGSDPDGGPDGAGPGGSDGGDSPPDEPLDPNGTAADDDEDDNSDAGEFALKPTPAGKPGGSRPAKPPKTGHAAARIKAPPGKKTEPPAERKRNAKSGRLEQLSLKIQAPPGSRTAGRRTADSEPLLTLSLPAGDLDDDLDLDEPPPKKPKSA